VVRGLDDKLFDRSTDFVRVCNLSCCAVGKLVSWRRIVAPPQPFLEVGTPLQRRRKVESRADGFGVTSLISLMPCFDVEAVPIFTSHDFRSVLVSVGSAIRCASVRGGSGGRRPKTRVTTGVFAQTPRICAVLCAITLPGQPWKVLSLRVRCSP
jgi:hypothetical protein